MKVPRDIPTDVEVFAVSSTGRYFALRYPMDPGMYQEILEYSWHHGMEILSTLLAVSEENPPVIGGLPSRKGQPCGLLMISLLLVWTRYWTNSLVVCDLRFYDSHVTSPNEFIVKALVQ